ncbi:MAG TPA: inositol monophosphatase family protein, partial [Pirellulales bacterium]
MSELMDVCEQAARLGGAILRQWEGKFSAKEKGPADLVTEADVASQEVIRDWVLKRFPEHDFLGEESVPEAISDRPPAPYRWIVDPLDGTMNYVHGLPGYAVSVALEHAGRIVCGCIFDPIADECFTA